MGSAVEGVYLFHVFTKDLSLLIDLHSDFISQKHEHTGKDLRQIFYGGSGIHIIYLLPASNNVTFLNKVIEEFLHFPL